MLSSARSDPPPGQDGQQGPHRSGHDSDDGAPPTFARRRGPARNLGRTAGLFGLLALVAAVAFPLAPVHQPSVNYSWTAGDGPTAIPLLPYQPVELTARTSCATVRDAPPEHTLLSTVPLQPDPLAAPLHGLQLTALDAAAHVTSAGVELGTVNVPEGSCSLSVVSHPERTAVLVDDEPVLVRDGDVRPDVAGAFSDSGSGVDLQLTTDTRFQTTTTPWKVAIGVVGVLALLGMLVTLHRAERVATPRVRTLPRRWWRPRPVDGVVTAVLGLWWAVGATTVDDGYIAGIVRSADSNGFIGNAYRWLNAPESPFSWFYELYHAWSLISPATPWMRVPSTLLGLLCWWLLSRLALPRLGRFAARRSAPWLAALAFLTWWIPFGLGLRPEPWVAIGALAVFLAVERAVATSRALPLALALVFAGATTAMTPGGLLAFTPFLAAGPQLLRILRTRRTVPALPMAAVLLAAPASAVFLMVPDQSLAGMLEAVRVRTAVGGGRPWYAEFERYALLFEPDTFQGAIGRRAAVLLTLLAAVGVLCALRRTSTGIAAGPARRLVIGFLLSAAMLVLAPTKWTQHFGDLAGYGAAVLVLGAVAWSAAPLRAHPRALVAGLAACTVVVSLVLAGYNLWPYTGAWFTPTFSTLPPRIADVPVATITLVAGAVTVAVLLGRRAWQRAGGAAESPPPRWLPAPTPLVVVVLVAVLALQVLGLVRVAVEHRDSYTLASDTVATLSGRPCGLQEKLSVETDPAAGLLPPVAGSRGPTAGVDVGGRTVPGVAVAGERTTPWFALDPAQRAQELPVVVTTSGTLRPGDALFLEFGDDGHVLERRPLAPQTPEPVDVREPAPAGADTVRLTVDAPEPGRRPAVASLPRAPQLTPMTQLLPTGTSAILDWPVAFGFPCLTPEPLSLGTAGLAEWRVGAPSDDDGAYITYTPELGGPFAAPRLLVTQQRMPTYLEGDPLREPALLYRWVPIAPLAEPEPAIAGRIVPGWHRDGHARVPGVDPVG